LLIDDGGGVEVDPPAHVQDAWATTRRGV
jgi:hypothetical protein